MDRPCAISPPGPDGQASVASRVWVDGRCVNQYECYEQDVKFSAYPKADIVLPNVTYLKKNGATVRGSVAYKYYSDADDWSGPYYYQSDYWCASSDIKDLRTLSPSLVLTRKQVEDLVAQGKIDGRCVNQRDCCASERLHLRRQRRAGNLQRQPDKDLASQLLPPNKWRPGLFRAPGAIS